MTRSSSAHSRTVFVTMPIWSMPEAKATRPLRLTRPYVGLSPTTPHSAAGCRTEPPVSDPSAAGTMRAATAAAEPPDEPPATQSRFHGLRVGPNAECSVDDPMANSSRFVLATMDQPLARRRATTVASNGERKSGRMRDPHVVGMSVVTMLSLMAMGVPAGAFSFTRSTALRRGLSSAILRSDSATSLTDHLRHDEMAAVPGGRVALGIDAPGAHDVIAQRRRQAGLQPGVLRNLHLRQLVDVRQDLRHLRRHAIERRLVKGEMGEIGDLLRVVAGDLHAARVYRAPIPPRDGAAAGKSNHRPRRRP